VEKTIKKIMLLLKLKCKFAADFKNRPAYNHMRNIFFAAIICSLAVSCNSQQNTETENENTTPPVEEQTTPAESERMDTTPAPVDTTQQY
jgi:hypothetical protein